MAVEQFPKMYLYRRIVQAKLFIDEHFAEAIDLENIADEAHFSKFHFMRLFKKIYGKSPHHYLTSLRIEKAKVLLQNNMGVKEVCTAVGFESLSSFSGLFKKTVGLSPSGYWAKEQAKKALILETPLHFVPACFSYQHGWSKNSNFEEAVL